MAMIDIQGFIDDLNNGEVDLDTVSDVANSPNPTTVTRMGDTIPTLRGALNSVMSTNGITVRLIEELNAITPPEGTSPAGRVTEGPGKGYYVWEGEWEETDDPAEDKETKQKVRALDRDTSNIYPDADISDASLYSGLPGQIVASSGTAPNRGIYQVDATSAAGSANLASFPVEAGREYYMGLRLGVQFTQPANAALFVDWFSEHEMTSLSRSDQIGERNTGAAYVNRYAQLTAPSNAVRARFRLDKPVTDTATSPSASYILVRRLTDSTLIAPSLLDSVSPPSAGPIAVRVTDTPRSYTHSLAGGEISNRPVMSNFVPYVGGSGVAARMTTVDGQMALREMVSFAAVGTEYPLFDVRAVIARLAAAITLFDIGVAWYKADKSVSDTPETIVKSYPNFNLPIENYRFTVGQTGSGAEINGPSDARYFIPFVRWSGAGTVAATRALVVNLDVKPHQETPDIPDVDVADMAQQIEERAYRSELDIVRIPRVTTAQAAALTPGERFQHEWYYLTDGDGLTHREDLPAHNQRPWAIDMDFPGGDYMTGSVGTGPDTVTIRARTWPTIPGLDNPDPGYIGARITGALGKTPVVTVTNANDWNTPRSLTRWRLVWGLDPDSDQWHLFDNQEYNDTTYRWIFSNDKPFDSDTIHLRHMPHFSLGRYDNKLREWTASRHTRPTPSAIDGYRIGTISARDIIGGKHAPAIDAYAFCAGNGPRAFAITTGVHPDEMPGHYIAEGIIDTILSPTPLGERLREAFTFYIYPRINSQNMWAGYRRFDVQTEWDMNREFGNPDQDSEVVNLYMPVWQTDLAPNLTGHIDCHSSPRTSPSSGPARNIWQRMDIASETARAPFVAAVQSYGPISTIDNFTAPYTTSYAMREMGTPKLVITAEYGHHIEEGISHWRNYGLDLMRALDTTKELF